MPQPTTATSLLVLFAISLHAGPEEAVCARCHPKEVASYARTGMAQSLFAISHAPKLPDGEVDHQASGTKFKIRNTTAELIQSSQWKNESTEQTVAFVIGSGNHAFGFLVQRGDHVFQSPLSYYVRRGLWDLAPGYENDPHPDFSRPLTADCLLCHADRPLPIPHTLNRYEPSVFSSLAISCDRCHGSPDTHLKKPIPGSILNPAKLTASVRDSVCEQCHLNGEVRIANPGMQISDFQPGMRTEDVYTTYVNSRPDSKEIKVVSHFEQLARSVCARQSAGRLWCGTCHNPHDKPTEAASAAYYRARCISCHAASLDTAHTAPDRDCVACHMPRKPAFDGGHTVFTDHRIARDPSKEEAVDQPSSIAAWRQPADTSLQRRNLALALARFGAQNQSIPTMERSYQMLRLLQPNFTTDPVLLSQLGVFSLGVRQSSEAFDLFSRLTKIEPDSAEAQTDLAASLIRLDRQAEAKEHLERAVALDPLFHPAVNLLGRLYLQQGDAVKAHDLTTSYQRAMGVKVAPVH